LGTRYCINAPHSIHGWRLTLLEKCIPPAKARRLSRFAELTHLQGDSKQEERCLNHAASVALPASWYAANFLVLEMGYVGTKNDCWRVFLAAWRARIIGDHAFRL
jgi:hypothetical protein